MGNNALQPFVKLKNLIVEYSNIPRQFKQVANIDLNLGQNNSKSLKVKIPIPPGATKTSCMQ